MDTGLKDIAYRKMEAKFWVILVYGVVGMSQLTALELPNLVEEAPLSRITFGSCANQSEPQPIWDAILQFNPQLFIWMGDNIYADNKQKLRIFGKERTVGPWKNVERFSPNSEKEIEFRYNLVKSNPGYSQLRRRAQVIGTWDDHDYGLNDAGKEYQGKNVSQRLMLDFLDEPPDSPRRKQAGVYTSYMFGPIGKQVKVILLDTRYHRDSLLSNGEMLGETQWTWLEEEIKNDFSQIIIIVSSIQRSGVIFMSGDVHFGEITRYDCGVSYPLYDITSSGLTQAVEYAVPSSLSFLVRLAARLTPSTMRLFGKHCRYKSCVYGKPNFGAIEIDWDANPVVIKMEVRDVHGEPVTDKHILLSELQTGLIKKTNLTVGETRQHCSLEVDLPWLIRHRLALSFYSMILVIFTLVLVLVLFLAIAVQKLRIQKLKVQ